MINAVAAEATGTAVRLASRVDEILPHWRRPLIGLDDDQAVAEFNQKVVCATAGFIHLSGKEEAPPGAKVVEVWDPLVLRCLQDLEEEVLSKL